MSATPMLDFVVSVLAPMSMDELEQIEKDTKISKWTLQKIRLRQIKSPGAMIYEPLYHHLKLLEVKKRRAAA